MNKLFSWNSILCFVMILFYHGSLMAVQKEFKRTMTVKMSDGEYISCDLHIYFRIPTEEAIKEFIQGVSVIDRKQGEKISKVWVVSYELKGDSSDQVSYFISDLGSYRYAQAIDSIESMERFDHNTCYVAMEQSASVSSEGDVLEAGKKITRVKKVNHIFRNGTLYNDGHPVFSPYVPPVFMWNMKMFAFNEYSADYNNKELDYRKAADYENNMSLEVYFKVNGPHSDIMGIEVSKDYICFNKAKGDILAFLREGASASGFGMVNRRQYDSREFYNIMVGEPKGYSDMVQSAAKIYESISFGAVIPVSNEVEQQ